MCVVSLYRWVLIPIAGVVAAAAYADGPMGAACASLVLLALWLYLCHYCPRRLEHREGRLFLVLLVGGRPLAFPLAPVPEGITCCTVLLHRSRTGELHCEPVVVLRNGMRFSVTGPLGGPRGECGGSGDSPSGVRGCRCVGGDVEAAERTARRAAAELGVEYVPPGERTESRVSVWPVLLAGAATLAAAVCIARRLGLS